MNIRKTSLDCILTGDVISVVNCDVLCVPLCDVSMLLKVGMIQTTVTTVPDSYV